MCLLVQQLPWRSQGSPSGVTRRFPCAYSSPVTTATSARCSSPCWSRPATRSSGSTPTSSRPARSAPNGHEVESLQADVRDVESEDLDGFDAVIHLAAVCNDPVGDLNPQATYDINHLASVRLAEKAKEAGVDALSVLVVVQPLRQGRATRCSTRAPSSRR